MPLKVIVSQILKENDRSLRWLADGMGKTVDGLRLSLINESIKYKDIAAMAKILNVSPAVFFGTVSEESLLAEPKAEYEYLNASLKTSKEFIVILKNQIKDKDQIIALLRGDKNT